jgi:trigger factor
MPIYLGDKNMFPEFKEGLKNIKEDEERIIETKGKDDKPKKVQVTCKKVEKIVFPELNEEFFKKVTAKDEIKTEEEFRDFVRKDIETAYKDISERAFRDDVIHEMVKLNEVSVPDLIVNNVLDNYVQHYKEQFPKNYNFKDFKEDEFRNQKRPEAIVQAKWFLMREKLVEIEKLEASDEDYKKIAEENSKKYNIPVDKLIETYKKNEELKNQILSNKVMDFLIENAKVTEKKEVRKAAGNKKT